MNSLIDTALFKRAYEIGIDISGHGDIDGNGKTSAVKQFTACQRADWNVDFPVFDVGKIFLNPERNGTFEFIDIDGIGIDSGNAWIGIRDVFKVFTGDLIFFKDFGNASIDGGSGKGFGIDFGKAVDHRSDTDFKNNEKCRYEKNKYEKEFRETSFSAVMFYGHGKHPCIIIYGSAENVKRKGFWKR